MKKITVSILFEDEKLDALEFCLRKQNSSVQKRMEETIRELYEKNVPQELREYLDTKGNAKPKRSSAQKPAEQKQTEGKKGEPEQGKAVNLQGSLNGGGNDRR